MRGSCCIIASWFLLIVIKLATNNWRNGQRFPRVIETLVSRLFFFCLDRIFWKDSTISLNTWQLPRAAGTVLVKRHSPQPGPEQPWAILVPPEPKLLNVVPTGDLSHCLTSAFQCCQAENQTRCTNFLFTRFERCPNFKIPLSTTSVNNQIFPDRNLKV